MDDRQRQIREGAGLAESRLNEEFIEFLQKWSMPILVVIALLAVGYAVYGKVHKARVEKVDLAFQEYEAAAETANPNPESLVRIAEQYDSVRAVPVMARVAAADSHLRIVRSGLKPGAQLKPDASLNSPDDALNDAERELNLNRAGNLYQSVLDDALRDGGQKIYAVIAQYGLASVAECRRDIDAAKSHYDKIVAMCTDGEFAVHAIIARERIDSLPALAKDLRLYHIADLAPPEAPPAAASPPVPLDDALKAGDGVRAPDPAPAALPTGAEAPADPASPAPAQPPQDPAATPPEKPGEPK